MLFALSLDRNLGPVSYVHPKFRTPTVAIVIHVVVATILALAGSFAQLACHVRDMARSVGAPLGAVLEGGYDPTALAESVVATINALDGEGVAHSIAPDPLVTSRAAAHIGHYWPL